MKTTHKLNVRAADIAETRAIAKEAYIYGFPMVDSYRIQHDYFVDRASREFKASWNQIVYRMGAAVLGIYGNSKQEAMYPVYRIDANGQKLTGANRYTLRFAPGQLPPVNAFWSLTMYELPASLLVANPINRYLINSPMLPQLKRDADGGLTLLIQNESPGKDKEANWLPAPKGPFAMYMRLYWPKEEALEGKWTAPPLEQAE
jgi:hypothetical protein